MALPSTYTQLNYIGTTGTQFIDTGFKPNQNTRVVMDFQSDNNGCHIFGARTEFLNKGFLVCWNSNFDYCVQVANTTFNGGTFDLTARHTIDMTASEFKLDGTSMTTYSVDAFQAEYNLYLASCPNSNESENMQGKIYSCKVYDNGTLVRDLIPCKDASGTVGMWDNVNSVFYANAGTGSFVEGDEYTTMPSSYTRLDNIKSTGTQYINTNVIPNINTKVVMKGFSAEKEPAWGVFFGSETADDSADAWRFRWHGSENVIACNLGSVGSSNDYRHFWQNYSAGTKLGVVEISKDGMYIDGAKANVSGASVAAISATYPMYIFGVNQSGSLVRPTTMSIARFSIYDNGTLVRDYIPCKTDSGEVGLWDEINGVFYSNSGSGTFSYEGSGGGDGGGSSSGLPNGYKRLEYIEGTGSQYIDTGFKANQDTRTVIDFQCIQEPSGISGIFGSESTASSIYYSFTISVIGGTIWSTSYNNDGSRLSSFDKNRHVVDKNKNQTYMDGVLVSNLTYGSFTCPSNMYLFSFSGDSSAYTAMRLYSCQIYDNDTLIRDFIPSMDSSGVVGLYDVVNGAFYASKTSTAFIGGKVVVSHNTLIDGTSRKIISGRTVVNGTGYTIMKGRTLIAGTGYDVTVQSKNMITVTINSTGYHAQSSGYKAYAYVTINNERYDTTTVLELEEGTTIACFVKQANSGRAIITIDGTQVVNTTTSETYNYTVTSDIIIDLATATDTETTTQARGSITITTT